MIIKGVGVIFRTSFNYIIQKYSIYVGLKGELWERDEFREVEMDSWYCDGNENGPMKIYGCNYNPKSG